jgi:hypothetical protein
MVSSGAMMSSESVTTEATDLFQRLTHSYREDLSRILWQNRTTTTSAETARDTFCHQHFGTIQTKCRQYE